MYTNICIFFFFFLQIHTGVPETRTTPEGLVATYVVLRLHLQDSHFTGSIGAGSRIGGGGSGGGATSSSSSIMGNNIDGDPQYNYQNYHQQHHNNGIILRCTAQIGNLYQEYAEVELGVPQRDPIPARGE